MTPPLTTIAPRDSMFEGDFGVYMDVGKAALDICKRALGARPVRRIIDFPSGHGRAMRWFRAEWPTAEIVAIETDLDALDFVAKTFDAKPLVSDPNLDMKIPGDADLIFSGSLLTHLDDWQWNRFLELCVDALAPDGTLVFTTHGRVAALLARDKASLYGDLIDTSHLFKIYAEHGFAYLPYSVADPSYGLTLSSPAWVAARLQALPLARIVAFEEQGWGQDVWALRKNGWSLVP